MTGGNTVSGCPSVHTSVSPCSCEGDSSKMPSKEHQICQKFLLELKDELTIYRHLISKMSEIKCLRYNFSFKNIWCSVVTGFFFTCGVNVAENSGLLKALQFEVRKITNKAFLYHHKHSWRCHDFMTIYVNIWWFYIHKCWRAVLTRGHWQHHQLHFLIWKSGFGMTPFVSETAVVLNVRW